MAKETPITAGQTVPFGRVGTGTAQVLDAPKSDPLKAFYRAKHAEAPDPKLLADRRKAENKAWETMMDHDYEKAWYVFQDEPHQKALKIREEVIRYREIGGNANDPRFKQKIQNLWDEVELTAEYTVGLKESFKEAWDQLKQNKKFYNWDNTLDAMNDQIFEEGPDGVRVPKSVYSMDREKFGEPGQDSKNFNMLNVWTETLQTFDDITDAHINKTGNRYMSRQQEIEYKGALMLYENGRLVLVNGMPVIDLNDEAKEVLMGHEFVKKYVEDQRAAGVSEEKIWAQPREILERNISRKEKKVDIQIFPEHYTDRLTGKDFSVTTTDSVPRLHNIIGGDGEVKQTIVNVRREHAVSGKILDKDIPIKTRQVFNIETGKIEKGFVGDQLMRIRSFQLLPVNYGERAKEEEETQLAFQETIGVGAKAEPGLKPEGYSRFQLDRGYIIYGDPEEVHKKQAKDPNTGVAWFAQGQMTDADGVTKQVLVPYEDVQTVVRELTGFDLIEIPLYQRHPDEVVDMVKKFYRDRKMIVTPDIILRKAKELIDAKKEKI